MAASLTSEDSAVLARPSFRSTVTLTPAAIKSAEQAAERGDLGQAAQLVDRILTDDVVRGALDTIIQTLLGVTPTITGTRSEELREDLGKILLPPEVSQILSWGLLLGVAPVQTIWLNDPAVYPRAIPTPEIWPPHSLKWSWDNHEWTSKDEDGQEFTLDPGSKWSFVTPYGAYRPWAWGLWRSIMPWYLLKLYAISDWGVHSEKASTAVITTPSDGVKQEDREALSKYIFERGKNATIALPAGCDFKLVELTANTEQIYGKQIEMANDGIAIALRGGNRTTSTVSGGYGAGVQADVEKQKIRFVAQTLTSWLSSSVFYWWEQFNFGSVAGDLALKYRFGTDADRLTRATTVKTWAEAIKALKDLGLSLDISSIQDEIGLDVQEV